MKPRLELRDVWKTYADGAQVLRGLSLAIAPAEIVLLVGENGAGKSTVLDIAAGAQKINRGRIRLNGRAVQSASPERRRRLGVRRLHQAPGTFGSLSVRDNALIGYAPDRFQSFISAFGLDDREALWKALKATASELDGLCPFLDNHHIEASTLSFGQRRIVEFIGAMGALDEHCVLLLDEPFAGIQSEVADAMWRGIGRAAAGGASVLMVEHAPDNQRFAGLRRLQIADGVAHD